MHPVAVETSKNETAETRSHAGLSRSSAGRQHVDEEQTGTFEGVCGCLATVTRSHATTATGLLPSLEQDIQTISALLPSEATLSRSANGVALFSGSPTEPKPAGWGCFCRNTRVRLSALSLVPAWTWAPHTAVHINLPVKRLCLVAPPTLF